MESKLPHRLRLFNFVHGYLITSLVDVLFSKQLVGTPSIADEFYSLFYLGLFCESRGEPIKAASYMKHATKTEYATGRGSGDYMTSCARVHCKLRGWS